LGEIASVYGSQSVVVSIDAKLNWLGKYQVYINDGTKKINRSAAQVAFAAQEAGAGEIFINAIHKDGTWEGYDEALIKTVADAVTLPVIACGGAGRLEDFKKAVAAGASAVAAGSMFVYQKKGMGVLISFPSNALVI